MYECRVSMDFCAIVFFTFCILRMNCHPKSFSFPRLLIAVYLSVFYFQYSGRRSG